MSFKCFTQLCPHTASCLQNTEIHLLKRKIFKLLNLNLKVNFLNIQIHLTIIIQLYIS